MLPHKSSKPTLLSNANQRFIPWNTGELPLIEGKKGKNQIHWPLGFLESSLGYQEQGRAVKPAWLNNTTSHFVGGDRFLKSGFKMAVKDDFFSA